MSFNFPDMAIRIRTSTLRNLEKLSPPQIILVVAVAVLCACFLAFLDKKKPEWKGLKNRLIMLAAMFVLIIIVLFLF